MASAAESPVPTMTIGKCAEERGAGDRVEARFTGGRTGGAIGTDTSSGASAVLDSDDSGSDRVESVEGKADISEGDGGGDTSEDTARVDSVLVSMAAPLRAIHSSSCRVS